MNKFQFYTQVYPTAAHFSEQFNRWQKQKSISKDAALFPTAFLLASPTIILADCTDNISGTACAKLNMGNALSFFLLQFGPRQRGEKGFFLYLMRIVNSVEAVFLPCHCFTMSIFTAAITQSNFFTAPALYTIKYKSWPLETPFYRREKQFSLHNISASNLSWKGCQLCWIMYKINVRCCLRKMGWH